MARKRGVRIKSDVELAQEIARVVIENRGKLRKLMQAESLSPQQKEKVISLVRKIESLKTEIRELGFDPKATIMVAAAAMRKEEAKAKTKSLNRKLRRRKGGVGMYGLGSKVKSWR